MISKMSLKTVCEITFWAIWAFNLGKSIGPDRFTDNGLFYVFFHINKVQFKHKGTENQSATFQ
jgi:hypothetical protein